MGDRIARLSDYCRANPDKDLARCVRDLFPELVALEELESVPPLPEQPPARWKTARLESETPPEFVRRIYGVWLGKGFTKAHLRQLDFLCYEALGVWSKTHDMPSGFVLPSLREHNDAWIQKVEEDQFGVLKLLGMDSPHDIQRLASLMVARIRGRGET